MATIKYIGEQTPGSGAPAGLFFNTSHQSITPRRNLSTIHSVIAMYIPPVSVFAPSTIELDADAVQAGIEQRLSLLTYLFCPEQEKEPNAVLERLRIETSDDGELVFRWRPRMRYPIRAYHFGKELPDQIRIRQEYSGNRPPKQQQLEAELFAAAADGVGFLYGYERDNMGWPLVIAAAAKLAEQSNGAIATTGHGWFVPDGNEVRKILEPPDHNI